MKRSMTLLGMFVLAGLSATPEPRSDGAKLDLTWHVIGGGSSAISCAGTLSLRGTIGPPVGATALTGGDLSLSGGFLFQIVPGDCNADAGISLLDFNAMPTCLTGPGPAVPLPACACFDSDGDGDIDLVDFAFLQSKFAAP